MIGIGLTRAADAEAITPRIEIGAFVADGGAEAVKRRPRAIDTHLIEGRRRKGEVSRRSFGIEELLRAICGWRQIEVNRGL